jgi:hypothetical protein
MTDLDMKWADAVLTAYPGLNVAPKPYQASCCCAQPFTYEGIRYESRNAGCALHGIRSRYVAQPASILKAKRADGHRHTAVNERE